MSASNQFQNPFNSPYSGQGVNGWNPAGPVYQNPADPYTFLRDRIDILERENTGLRSSLDETSTKLEEMQGKFKNVSKKLTAAENKIDDLGNNISQVRNKTLEPLAVFVGLFTFVSIGFQMFANVKEPMLWPAILMIVLGGIIILAGLIIHASSIAKDVEKRRIYTGLIVFVGLVIGLTGFGAYSFTAWSMKSQYKECVSALSAAKAAPGDIKTMCQEG